MWSPTRLCAPLVRLVSNAVPQPCTLWQRSFHLLSETTSNIFAVSVRQMNPLKSTMNRLPIQRVLLDSSNGIPLVNQSCGFKFKRVLKRRCKDCYYVVRENRLHVICKTHPRHKQLAITQPEKSTWILTHAMQSKVRPY